MTAGRIELSRILAGETHAPVVYFARMGDNVKIGTTTNLKGRMRTFYLSLEDVLVVVPGGEDTEAAYHRQFAESRVQDDSREELFRIDARLSFFLGLWRSTTPKGARKRPGLPFHLTPKEEIGTILGLDDELRKIEGGGRGPWDIEKVADIVARLTYLGSIADEGTPRADAAQDSAYYWNATNEQCMEELAALAEEAAGIRPRWWQIRGWLEWHAVRDEMKRIQAHADRAAIIRDLFVDALQGYEPRDRNRRAGRK